MPRWSNTIRSRVSAIGPSNWANCSANGIAACPGPPASATIASFASPTGARWRRIASVIVPGVPPLGSSGTVRWPQAKSLLSPQGANAICAWACVADAAVQTQTVTSTPASLESCISRNLPAVVRGRAIERHGRPRARLATMTDPREIVQAPGAPAAIGPYSHAVRAGGLLFCSGQIPLDPASGELVGETPAEQARRCLENLGAVCEAAGTTLERAVRVTIYMTDLAAFTEVNEVYGSFLGKSRPQGRSSAWPSCRRALRSRSTRSSRCRRRLRPARRHRARGSTAARGWRVRPDRAPSRRRPRSLPGRARRDSAPRRPRG